MWEGFRVPVEVGDGTGLVVTAEFTWTTTFKTEFWSNGYLWHMLATPAVTIDDHGSRVIMEKWVGTEMEERPVPM